MLPFQLSFTVFPENDMHTSDVGSSPGGRVTGESVGSLTVNYYGSHAGAFHQQGGGWDCM